MNTLIWKQHACYIHNFKTLILRFRKASLRASSTNTPEPPLVEKFLRVLEAEENYGQDRDLVEKKFLRYKRFENAYGWIGESQGIQLQKSE